MVDLAEALLMLNLNASPSVETLLSLLKGDSANFNAGIGEDLVSALCKWLRNETNTKGKDEYKTPQTQKSRARTVSGNSRDTDSDGNSDDNQRVPQTSASEDGYRKIQELMAAKRVPAIKQNDENDENLLKRLISQSIKMKDKHLIELVMCHAC